MFLLLIIRQKALFSSILGRKLYRLVKKDPEAKKSISYADQHKLQNAQSIGFTSIAFKPLGVGKYMAAVRCECFIPAVFLRT